MRYSVHSSCQALLIARRTFLCETTGHRKTMPPSKSRTIHLSPRDKSVTATVSLKLLAEHLGLSKTAVSLVINRSPEAKSIPKHTQERIRVAARELNYRPNFIARSLRHQRSFTVGVVVPEISEGYAALVLSGIENHLSDEGYFYFVVSHRHRKELLEEYPSRLQQRSVEGLIAVDTECTSAVDIPVVAVSGHREIAGVTNIVLNHTRAAKLALEHLTALGHSRIAFIKGQDFSSDTEVRWEAVLASAKKLGLEVNPTLTGQLEGESSSPQLGYEITRKLLSTQQPFTALFAFNDVSAVGFDDIESAAFQNPALTTVRQPLRQMGVIAAETLLQRINAPRKMTYPKAITIEPEFIVRATTAPRPPRSNI